MNGVNTKQFMINRVYWKSNSFWIEKKLIENHKHIWIVRWIEDVHYLRQLLVGFPDFFVQQLIFSWHRSRTRTIDFYEVVRTYLRNNLVVIKLNEIVCWNFVELFMPQMM